MYEQEAPPPENDEEEESDERVDKKPKKPVDPEKAFQNLTDVKKYDYLLGKSIVNFKLFFYSFNKIQDICPKKKKNQRIKTIFVSFFCLGMSMWMLTDERKNELLKQRDNKLSELAILKAKTPESIWEADLEALEKKLDEVEEKERQEELGVNAKKMKQAASTSKAAAGKRKRAAKANDEIYPSTDGIKIEFKVTDEILKKYEKMAAATARSKAKKEAVENGEGDEFDSMVKKEKKPGKFDITRLLFPNIGTFV